MKLAHVQKQALTHSDFEELYQKLNLSAVERIFRSGKNLYFHTYWIEFDQGPANRLEELILKLCRYVDCSNCTGIEWWLSVSDPNATPYWLLKPHFDREDISDNANGPMIHPKTGSVLFLRSVPYGELVIFDQEMKHGAFSPVLPQSLEFILPKENHYCIFRGNLLHGVMGRLWRKQEKCPIRIALSINYWKNKPTASYVATSLDFEEKFLKFS